MNKIKYIILTLMLFIFNTHSISAACSEEEINNFKKVEDEYTVKYKANVDTKDYSITFTTPLQNEYAYSFGEEINTFTLESETKTSFTYTGIKPGKYSFEIISLISECEEALKIIELKLSEFNKYFEDPLCKGIEEFVLCSPTYEKEIDYDTFVSRVETYKKTKAKKEAEAEKNKEPEEENQFAPVINYIKDNLITIIIIAVFIILVIITTIITAKSIRKSRRLE